MEFCDLSFDDSFIGTVLDIHTGSKGGKPTGDCIGWLSRGEDSNADSHLPGCANPVVQKLKSRAIY